MWLGVTILIQDLGTHGTGDSSVFSGVSVPMIWAVLSGAVYVGLEQGVGSWISVVMVAMHAVDAGFAGLQRRFLSLLLFSLPTLGLIQMPER
jgi:hypothetical protein